MARHECGIAVFAERILIAFQLGVTQPTVPDLPEQVGFALDGSILVCPNELIAKKMVEFRDVSIAQRFVKCFVRAEQGGAWLGSGLTGKGQHGDGQKSRAAYSENRFP